ncbi:MerR HTH family regulatory protein [Lutimaribacter pacificus]|uniref:MerR HTH family regulatory protein n=1 Tax=Lutimaribacter pacificus TaxID=391948 RepID=A0A1H0LLE3_9RHOB|nr:MerR family transcriptional regulator [Lutimaribacter pacificus]SDO69032.1 MerR HTH family regulatory protein [Lutimaribacter pacificus]SHK05808.1 MerR HTH family regulatory protein [Lutimaribacter pacificus]
MAKSPDAFRTISEVAEWLDKPAHVLRFWESKFTQVKPVKRAGGRRYYRPEDMLLLGGIKKLLHDDGMTIKGVQKILREQGVKQVSALSQPLDEISQAAQDATTIEAGAMAPEPAPAPESQSPEAPPQDIAGEDIAAPDQPETALPAFLHTQPEPVPQGAEPGPAEPDTAPPPPRPAIIEVAEVPPPDRIEAAPGILSAILSRRTPLAAPARAKLAGARDDLARLRTRLAQNGKE